ncbi:MAG: TolC family protein [Leptospirales bacterium]|nr:TolC family protein [Leptospirales bacterium]
MKKYPSCFILLVVWISGLSAGQIYTWDDCVRAALDGNPELLSSKERIGQSEAAKGVARSPLLPNINASASADRSKSYATNRDAHNRYSYGLSARQLLFDGLKSFYSLRAADADIETSIQSYDVTSASVRFSLKSAYISLLKTQEMVKILEDIRTRRKHVMDLVKIKYDSGGEHRGSWYSARADFFSAEASVRSAKREVELAKKNLLFIMGFDEEIDFGISGKIEPALDYKEKPDFVSIAAKNPQCLRSGSELKSAELSMKTAQTAFSPRLSASGNVGRAGETLNDMPVSWSIGLEVSAPLFSGGETWYSYKRAQAVYNQAFLNDRNVKNETMKKLEESWNSLMNSIENVDVQKANLDAVTERSRIGEAQYSIGTLSFDNWTIIENNLSNARRAYLEACAEALTSEARWVNSIGGTLDNEIVQ